MNDESIALFRQNWRARFESDPKSSYIYQEVSAGITPAGVEYYLPLFFNNSATLFNYLPDTTQLFTFSKIDLSAENFWLEINNRYEDRRYDVTRPLLAPAEIYLPVNELFSAIKPLPRIKIDDAELTEPGSKDIGSQIPPSFSIDHHAENPLLELKSYLQNAPSSVLSQLVDVKFCRSCLSVLR